MPAIAAIFNRFFLVLTASYVISYPSAAALPSLAEEQYLWLGQQVFRNECNQQLSCLTHWNEGEDFPSLGIGHFIWYRQGQEAAFEETFPLLLQFLQERGRQLPARLSAAAQADNPWPDRASFYAAIDSPAMRELRAFLQDSMDLQAAFIAQRLERTASSILASVSGEQRQRVENNFSRVANANAPMGLYALIDYLHFKGSGLSDSERYQQQGWGLKQVLLAMDDSGPALDSFVAAASAVLTLRVNNAPAERNERRWLAGWQNRLMTYLAAIPGSDLAR